MLSQSNPVIQQDLIKQDHLNHSKLHNQDTSDKRSILAGTGYINASQMTDSTHLYNRHQLNMQPLLDRLRTDGYLLLRNVIPPSQIKSTRKYLINDMKSNNFIIPSSISDSKMLYSPWPDSLKAPNLLGRHDLMLNEKILATLNHPFLQTLMTNLLSNNNCKDELTCSTLPYKWLRAVGSGLFTGPHMDRVYLPNDSNLLTCWIPLGDIPVENGAIIVANESHTCPSFSSIRQKYGSLQIGSDKAESGWITHDPSEIDQLLDNKSLNYQIDWKTTDFKSGDVCIFGIDTIHMTVTNVTKNWRLSCDTRWLRK